MNSDGFVLSSQVRSVGRLSTLEEQRRCDELLRLRRGVYVDRERYEGAGPLRRYRDRAIAVALQRRSPVFAGFTAAVLHGLPSVGRLPGEIFLLAGGPSGRRRNGVVEIARTGAERLVEIDDWAAVDVVDAVIDVAKRMPLLTALVMADAALHAPRFGEKPPRCTSDDLRAAYQARMPFPASSAVRAVIERAVPDADTPIETLSRLRFEELGVPAPLRQFAVPLPRLGRVVHLDFAWPELGVWGEADGAEKYGSGPEAARVVRAEKLREDEIRAETGWRCARWSWRDAWDRAPLRDILSRAGVRRNHSIAPVRPPSAR
ncbi:hypothetical protein GCM10025870_07060 [Agromyces marinus]|uniref:Transcriptional regulator, AbiEi antitoxin, Type IV TA system n=1 Tax=Agromyces marinus TaxID=1389020 RepID=A0ABM8GYR0_9MICO|nr:hypothetical protein [Agromyces marinus]BDZ53633.1 hypothetical protein GCM10025870_07060 [Agromyces marinus]